MTDSNKKSVTPNNLPSYNNPPVNEVVCGMRFQEPNKLRITHFGLLWDLFRKDYPVVEHASPISSDRGEIPIDDATGLPFPRVWFISESDDELIQFQFDRFYFNWRRRDKDYPRYSHVIANFEKVQDTVKKFFNNHNLGELAPIENELSYINHMTQGKEWNDIDDIPTIFSDFIWERKESRFLPNPINISWKASFPLPDDKGRLTITLKQATLVGDKTPLLILELKAKGVSKSTSPDAIRDWYDTAHEWIVRGFTDLITKEMQEYWGRVKNA